VVVIVIDVTCVITLAALGEPSLEGIHGERLEDVLAALGQVLRLLAGQKELSASVVVVLFAKLLCRFRSLLKKYTL
jgi:hypothetical protein